MDLSAWTTVGARALVLTLLCACDPAEEASDDGPEEQTIAECVADLEVEAWFSLELPTWRADGDTLAVDAPCSVDEIVERSTSETTVRMRCARPDGGEEAAELELLGEPAVPIAFAAGDAVTLHLRREAWAESYRGSWTLRDAAGALLLAGNRANMSHPNDPDFFAPLRFEVEADLCAQVRDGCYANTPLVLAVDDGDAEVRVGHHQRADLPSGLRVQVGYAMLTSSSSPKSCPVDGAGPETYQLLVARLP